RVVDALKLQGEPQYIDAIIDGIPEGMAGDAFAGLSGEDSTESDVLYDEAVRIVTETRKASISGVQRRLKIGYNRAARLIEHMESVGLVGPLESNGARAVLAPAPPSL
ncbi:MAG: S-DNA-T family DNA segregation ATPase FtsK/SpoIIIE, partial [Gammaproteobacteria bacterium]